MAKDSQRSDDEKDSFSLVASLHSMERAIHKLSLRIASLEDALSHLTRIPNLPLELHYDHRTNTLWAETRRKLEFTKNEAALMSVMFTATGKPKKKVFQCSEVAQQLRDRGEGIDNAKQVFVTANRVKKKVDEFLNTEDVIVVSVKSFHFSLIALK